MWRLATLGIVLGACVVEGAARDVVAVDTGTPDVTPDVARDVAPDGTAEADAGDPADADAATAETGDDVINQDADDTRETSDAAADMIDDEASATEVDADTVEVDVGPAPCDPPLALAPQETWTFAFGGVTLVASGGTGAYRFAAEDAATGPLLNTLTGAYLAGRTTGDDHVTLVDLGCVGQARATIHVVPPMVVSPREVTLPPGTRLTPTVTGGSGQVLAALADDDGGATLEGMTYTAGASDGLDDVLVIDVQTGQVESVRVIVQTGAHIEARPRTVHVPVGHRFVHRAVGGSGHLTGDSDDAGLVSEGGAWRVLAPGHYEVELVDVYTGQRAPQTVVGMAPLSLPVARTGTNTFHYSALGPGDLDGDGNADAVVGIGEANVTRFQSGAVYVYAGRAGGDDEGPGLDPTPVQVLSGGAREDTAGRAIAVGDLDADGEADLVMGVWRADAPGLGDNGAIAIHRGVPGGFFEPTAARVLTGPFGGDQLGYALAVCDFDGDGHLDVAGGAWVGEDHTINPLLANQGAIFVYRGAAGALPGPAADQALYGVVPGPDETWVAAANVRAGSTLAAGDFDGDGYCDLVNANPLYTNIAANDGLVQVFRGGPDGLDPTPAFALVGDSAGGSRLGLYVAAGDLDGDGLDDLAVGQGYWNRDTSDRTGALRLFRGGEAFMGPAAGFASPDDADLTLTGVAGSDFYGYQVAIGDADGVAPLDLAVGVWLGECPGCPSNGGRVDVHAGVAGALPSPTPSWQAHGAAAEDRLGSALAVVGPGRLVSVAGLDDSLGSDVPRPWLVTPEGTRALDAPGEPGGWRVGHAVAELPDLDGDGLAELAVGAANERAVRTNGGFHLLGGVVHVHRGTASGFASEAAYALQDFPGHSGSDWYGAGLAATDFDADGASDLVVVARFEDAPATWSAATYTTIGTCPAGARNNSGAVYVHAGDEAAGRVGASPAWVRFGPQADQTYERALALDVDGDGLGDVIAASVIFDREGASDAGGFELVRGRARVDGGRVGVVCTGDWLWTGTAASDQAGSALAALGDVDGDGCQDFALGAWLEDGGASNQGAVRVVYGWGAGCAAATPRAATLVPGAAEDRAGQSLAAGDVDGDGRLDLVAGGTQHRRDGVPVGAAWLVDGRRLAALVPEPLVVGVAPTTRAPLSPDVALRVEGVTRDEAFGLAVALGPGVLAVASQASDAVGVPAISLVRLYAVSASDDGLVAVDPEPLAVIGGESEHTRAMREAALVMVTRGDAALLVMGATESRALALDTGAVFVTPIGGAP